MDEPWHSRGRPGSLLLLLLVLALGVSACGGSGHRSTTSLPRTAGSDAPRGTHSRASSNVYAADGPNDLSPVVRNDLPLVYVPNSMSNTVSVISQKTFKVIAQFPTGALPQHVTPAYDLKTLYVDNDDGNSLTPINPSTGKPGTPIPVDDPYNLYFTPNGQAAIVVEERLQILDFRDPTTMRQIYPLPVHMCPGVDHMDFSADGRYAYASCEFGGRMIEVDLQRRRVIRTLELANGNSSPQDVKLSPDGRTLYVADQAGGGIWEINPASFTVETFVHTGAGAHGLYPSRNAKDLYVSNRSAGSISVVSFASRHVIETWQLPLPASPDMGGVSADGSTLWLSGRYDATVYAIDTRTGHLRASIPVGEGPHGLCVWPQPGRYSLGHTGIMR